MSDIVPLLFNLGTFFCFLATLPLILVLWKDRKSLRGLSFFGSLTTLLGVSCFMIAYILLKIWISFCLEIPVFVFWLLATIYSRR